MAANTTEILPKAVEFVLDNWTVLQLAIQHGFGGVDCREKVIWLKEVICQVLSDNQNVESEELEDYVSEILYNEFNTVVEDGSLEKISKKLCQFQSLWRAGNTQSIEKEIQTVTPVKLSHSASQEEKDDEEESSQNCMCDEASASSTQNIQDAIGNLTIATDMPQTAIEAKNEEEEDGWEVVRRSKKR